MPTSRKIGIQSANDIPITMPCYLINQFPINFFVALVGSSQAASVTLPISSKYSP